MSNTIINLHAIHGFPMSNLNRDRNGMPKLAIIDGEPRRYFSSQSFRRAYRTHLTDNGTDEGTVLSRHFINDVARAIANGAAPTQEQIEQARAAFQGTSHGSKDSLDKQRVKLTKVAKSVSKRMVAGASLSEALQGAAEEIEVAREKKIASDRAKYIAKQRKLAEENGEEVSEEELDEAALAEVPETEEETESTEGDESAVALGSILDERITMSDDGASFTIGYYTGAAFPYSPASVAEFAKIAVDESLPAKERGSLGNEIIAMSSPNIASFGRMFANSPKDGTTGAMQLAPPISVSPTSVGSDFYVAHDDRATGNGAAMMGTIEFDAPVMYRYANIDLRGLAENLEADGNEGKRISDVAARLAEAFIFALPTGSQSKFAAHTLPSVVLVTIGGRPVNYSNAFRDPVEGPGVLEKAASKLVKSEQHARRIIGDKVTTLALDVDDLGEAFGLGNVESVPELLESLREYIEAER